MNDFEVWARSSVGSRQIRLAETEQRQRDERRREREAEKALRGLDRILDPDGASAAGCSLYTGGEQMPPDDREGARCAIEVGVHPGPLWVSSDGKLIVCTRHKEHYQTAYDDYSDLEPWELLSTQEESKAVCVMTPEANCSERPPCDRCPRGSSQEAPKA